MDKGRDQSIYEFFECLQLEYLIFELRRKIYQYRKDKAYCERVMEYKKRKILDIAERNAIESIFSDPELRLNLRKKVYGDKGYPKFHLIDYKSEAKKKEFAEKDLEFYYSIGTDMRVEVEENQFEVGTLEKIFHDKGICHVKLRHDSEITISSIACLTRIL